MQSPMNERVKLAPCLLLLDVRVLSQTVNAVRRILSARIGRSLPDADLVLWLDYLALDAGLQPGSGQLQALLVAQDAKGSLPGFLPSSLSQIDGKACRSALGEWNFSVVSSAHLTSSQALFTDLMELAVDSSEVETLMLLPYHSDDEGEAVATHLAKLLLQPSSHAADKRIVYYHLQPLQQPLSCSCQSLVFPLMRAFGIREEELR